MFHLVLWVVIFSPRRKRAFAFYSLDSRDQPDAGTKDVVLHDDLGGARRRWGKLNTKINDDALAHGRRESELREVPRGGLQPRMHTGERGLGGALRDRQDLERPEVATCFYWFANSGQWGIAAWNTEGRRILRW